MKNLYKISAAAILATFALVIIANGASERRADYLEAESEYYSCIESGLSRTECLTVFD